ncbi:MAG: hypothetical protein FWD33_01340 [Alphaproteobacteria bacterium]|nr:hypothetical protein [Alphaproteobacteria bacterium]
MAIKRIPQKTKPISRDDKLHMYEVARSGRITPLDLPGFVKKASVVFLMAAAAAPLVFSVWYFDYKLPKLEGSWVASSKIIENHRNNSLAK